MSDSSGDAGRLQARASNCFSSPQALALLLMQRAITLYVTYFKLIYVVFIGLLMHHPWVGPTARVWLAVPFSGGEALDASAAALCQVQWVQLLPPGVCLGMQALA
ncbi:hypothetical protein NDU88_001176 [Pleurodeles waltl]|uniref:Uncharacterized protein n=1 Tax=Pleurodeles waltl TaxID=8319 RepID=A0AAV7RAV2_PLEWA|nr:hypothetical protein NDU88_001176 [Pleurodeles waltl]